MSSVMQFICLLALLSVVLASFDKGDVCKEISSDDCESFRKAVEVLNLRGQEAADFIKEASRKGIHGARGVKGFIKQRLDKELSTKTCDDIVDKKQCQKIKGLVDQMQGTGNTVKESIKNLIDEGKSHVESTIEKLSKEADGSSFSFDGFLFNLIKSNDTRSPIVGRDDLMSLHDVLLNVFDKTTSIFRTAIGKLVVLINEKMLNMKRKVQLIIEQKVKEQRENEEPRPSVGYSSYSETRQQLQTTADEFSDDVEGILKEIGYGIRDMFNPDAVADRRVKNRVILETVVEHLTKAFREVAGKSGRIIKDIRNTMKKTGNKMIDISKIVFDNVVEIVEQLKRKGVFRKRQRIMDGSRPIEVSGKLYPSRKGWKPSKSKDSSINWNPNSDSRKRRGSSRDQHPEDSSNSRRSDDGDRSYPNDRRDRSYDTEDDDDDNNDRPYVTVG